MTVPDGPATLTAQGLADLCQGTLLGSDAIIHGVCPIDDPRPGCVTFLRPGRPADAVIAAALRAGAIVIAVAPVLEPGPGTTMIIADHPRLAFTRAFRALHSAQPAPGPDSSAWVHDDARIPATSSVGVRAWIGPRVVIGDHCVIHPMAVLGGPGFGFADAPDGERLRMPHVGGVILGSQVDVGSFTTVREGTMRPTVLGDLVKVDDHVHIAHNCQVDVGAVITAGATIAGSVRIGAGAWIGPNATISDGCVIGADVFIGAGAVVLRDCLAPGVYSGNPARKFADR